MSSRPDALPLFAHGLIAHPPGHEATWWECPDAMWNVGYTVSGRVREILAEGETWEHPGDFMVLKPGGRHRWGVPSEDREPWRVVFFVFVPKPDWIPLLDLPEEFPRFSRIPLAARNHTGNVRRALLQAHRVAGTPVCGQALGMNALERALLWLQAALADTNARLDPRVQAAMELFSRQLSEPPTMPETAEACGLSLSRLTELFRKCTGVTPRVWSERARLSHGRNLLLTTGLPVKLVAAQCGYDDQRHFATRFRKHFGLPPGKCRRGSSL